MLINSDFERHGFELHREGRVDKLYTKHPECKYDLLITKSRPGYHIVRLHIDGVAGPYELMWSPDQLRVFLLFHKVITP